MSTNNMTEKQIDRIKKKIKDNRAFLSAEKRKFGDYFDNNGIRYVIPELYVSIQDFKGAQRYFNWFEKVFENDICYPYLDLIWSLTLFENKKLDKALQKLYKTTFANTYILELICGKNPIQNKDIESIESRSLQFAQEMTELCLKPLTPGFRTWLSNIIETDEYKKNISRFISLQKQMNDSLSNADRRKFYDASQKMVEELTGEYSNYA